MDVLREIREILIRHTDPGFGVQETPVPRLGVFRADHPSSTPTPGIYDPMLCIVVAGRKQGFLRKETHTYTAGDALLITVDLPVVGTILEANAEAPYLALSLRLHRPTLVSVVLEAEPVSSVQAEPDSLRVDRADPALLDAALRMARLLDRTRDIDVLAPLIEREILYRLLVGRMGGAVLEISRSESRTSQVGRAVAWLRENYAAHYDAAVLAEIACMSVSSLNRHFRAVTAMSPLEYQKEIRLQEARRLLLIDGTDVSSVGRAVGYSSVTQFTREYRRLFDAPPRTDADRLREEVKRGTTSI